MNQVKPFHSPAAALLLALVVVIASPVFASDQVELNMTLGGSILDASSGGPPFFSVISNGTGHAVINDINVPVGTSDILGLHVQFDVQVCQNADCAQVVRTLHCEAHLDNTTGTVTADPANPDQLFVSANPTSGRIHIEGSGSPATGLLFAGFDYSNFPTVGYDVNFAFTSSEFNGDVIIVSLHGPV